MSDRAAEIVVRIIGVCIVAALVLAVGRLLDQSGYPARVVVVTACDPSIPAWLQIESLRERADAGAPLTDCDLDMIAELAEEVDRCIERPDYYEVPICWDDLNRCEETCSTDRTSDEPTVWGDIVERLDDCQRSTADSRRTEMGSP